MSFTKTTGPPPAPTGPPPAPTTGPPSDHRRTTVGAPLAPIGTSDHCRTTAGPLPDHRHHRTTIGPPPDHHWTPAGPPSVHHLHPSAHRTTVGAPPAPIGTSDHCRTTAGPLSDYRRCDVDDADALPGLHLLPNFSVAAEICSGKVDRSVGLPGGCRGCPSRHLVEQLASKGIIGQIFGISTEQMKLRAVVRSVDQEKSKSADEIAWLPSKVLDRLINVAEQVAVTEQTSEETLLQSMNNTA
ncbi:hypothetical protein LXL04_001762 [Taraxacum kok-saghyz]